MGNPTNHLPYRNQPWFKNSGVPARTELTGTQLEFLEWLVDPEAKGTQAEWAHAHGVAPSTTTTWKRHPLFIEMWNARLKELNVAPLRIQRVLDSIWAAAVSGETKAAQLYLQYVDRFTPKQEVVIKDRAVSELSNEELIQALEGRE